MYAVLSSARMPASAALRYFGIITCTAGGPGYEDANPASKPRGRGAADARSTWASGPDADHGAWSLAVTTRTRTRRSGVDLGTSACPAGRHKNG